MTNKIGERVYGSHGGERKWISTRIKGNTGKILSFGCDPSASLSLELAKRGFHVTGVDLLPPKFSEEKPKMFDYLQADITNLKFPNYSFDYIVSCSSLEHAGLAGRYDSKNDLDQDLRISRLFKRWIKRNGLYFLTIPVGIEATMKPWHRVYGMKRLSQIVNDWQIMEKEFWNFNLKGNWYRTTEEEAFKQMPRVEKPFLAAKGLYLLKLK